MRHKMIAPYDRIVRPVCLLRKVPCNDKVSAGVSRYAFRMKRYGMGQASNMLEILLSNLDTGHKIREGLAVVYWPRVAGEQVAAASQAEEVRNGVLMVRTKGSVWSQELSLMKHRLLPELNRLCGKPVIKDITFRSTGLPSDEDETEDDAPTPADLEELLLTDEDRAALDADLAAIEGLPDDDVRRRLEAILERQHRLRRWRLDHGWRPCDGCRTLHRGPDALCTVCLAARHIP